MTAPRRSERSNSRRARSASASSSRERDASSTRAEGSDDGGAVVAGDAEAEEDTTTSARRGERSDTPSGDATRAVGAHRRRARKRDVSYPTTSARTPPREDASGDARARTPCAQRPHPRTCTYASRHPARARVRRRETYRVPTTSSPGSAIVFDGAPGSLIGISALNLSPTSVVQGQLPHTPPLYSAPGDDDES